MRDIANLRHHIHDPIPMKRRKILKLSSGAIIALPACSAKRDHLTPDAVQSLSPPPVNASSQPVKVGANTQYRPPAYVNQGLRNPNMNLPSQFSGTTVSHSRGLSTNPYVAMTFDDGPHPQNTPRLLDMLPYGALLTRQRSAVFSDFGYPTIMWSVDPQDWKRPGPSVVASRILKGAHNGAIILAHDLHSPTVDAMPKAFDGLLSRGFQFISVSQLLAQKGQA